MADEVKSLVDFRRWLMDRQPPPHAGTDTIHWLDPKEVLQKFDAVEKYAEILDETGHVKRFVWRNESWVALPSAT